MNLKEAERLTKLYAQGTPGAILFTPTPGDSLSKPIGNFIICQFCELPEQREEKYHFKNRKPTCANCNLARIYWNYWENIKTKNPHLAGKV